MPQPQRDGQRAFGSNAQPDRAVALLAQMKRKDEVAMQQRPRSEGQAVAGIQMFAAGTEIVDAVQRRKGHLQQPVARRVRVCIDRETQPPGRGGIAEVDCRIAGQIRGDELRRAALNIGQRQTTARVFQHGDFCRQGDRRDARHQTHGRERTAAVAQPAAQQQQNGWNARHDTVRLKYPQNSTPSLG